MPKNIMRNAYAYFLPKLTQHLLLRICILVYGLKYFPGIFE